MHHCIGILSSNSFTFPLPFGLYDLFQAQIFEGKEPDQFFWVTQRLIVVKVCALMAVFPFTQIPNSYSFVVLAFKQGGTSTRYIDSMSEKGFADYAYDVRGTILFRIQGSSPQNMQAVQVNMVRIDNLQTLNFLFLCRELYLLVLL